MVTFSFKVRQSTRNLLENRTRPIFVQTVDRVVDRAPHQGALCVSPYLLHTTDFSAKLNKNRYTHDSQSEDKNRAFCSARTMDRVNTLSECSCRLHVDCCNLLVKMYRVNRALVIRVPIQVRNNVSLELFSISCWNHIFDFVLIKPIDRCKKCAFLYNQSQWLLFKAWSKRDI